MRRGRDRDQQRGDLREPERLRIPRALLHHYGEERKDGCESRSQLVIASPEGAKPRKRLHFCHCEARSAEAISGPALDCFAAPCTYGCRAALAMTGECLQASGLRPSQ